MSNTNTPADSTLPEYIEKKLIEHSNLKKFSVGEIIFAAGDASEYVYLVKNGGVRICHFAKNGTSITLLSHNKGELIGMGGVLDHRERAVYAIASKGGCELWQLQARDFFYLMETNTDFSYYIAISLARRLRVLDTQILRQISIRANDRLAVVLFDMAIKSSVKIDGETAIKITQQELSDVLGTCRQTTTTMIGKLKDEKIVDTKKGYILIKDLNKLQKLALQIDS